MKSKLGREEEYTSVKLDTIFRKIQEELIRIHRNIVAVESKIEELNTRINNMEGEK